MSVCINRKGSLHQNYPLLQVSKAIEGRGARTKNETRNPKF